MPSVLPAPLLVELGPEIACAGFYCEDHAGVIAELGPLVPSPSLTATAVPKRRAEFLAGRFAARTALAALGIDSTPGRDGEGRPVWPTGVVGSITHGAGRALSAVASIRDVRGVGIDVERLMSASVKDELIARICDEAERAVLSRLQVSEPASVTFAFSAKESLYKCLFPHVQRFMDFRAATVVDAVATEVSGVLRGELVLELSVDWTASLPRGLRFTSPFVSSAEHVETGVAFRP